MIIASSIWQIKPVIRRIVMYYTDFQKLKYFLFIQTSLILMMFDNTFANKTAPFHTELFKNEEVLPDVGVVHAVAEQFETFIQMHIDDRSIPGKLQIQRSKVPESAYA